MSRSIALTDVPLSRTGLATGCDDASLQAHVGFPAPPNGSAGLGGQSRRTIGRSIWSVNHFFIEFGRNFEKSTLCEKGQTLTAPCDHTLVILHGRFDPTDARPTRP